MKGETGVCKVTIPEVASATLHPAPPESYTVFMAGCNLKCLNCQNWTISQYPDNRFVQRGFIDPAELAEECVEQLGSISGRQMGADRIFFSGGEPTLHLPYIEQIVEEARKISPVIKVNYDTNGYMTHESLIRVLNFTTSITYDLKAYHNDVHLALTGTSSTPVLRNATYIGKYAKDKLWEYRIVVIPRINENEIKHLTEFIADIDPSLPVSFLAFRPNFLLQYHPGAPRMLMERCVNIARRSGLKNAYWSGHTGISGKVADIKNGFKEIYLSDEARLAGSYAFYGGCRTHLRDCKACCFNQECQVKKYIPRLST
jgi:pyruvate formate lyase activating enzyme